MVPGFGSGATSVAPFRIVEWHLEISEFCEARTTFIRHCYN